MKRRKENRLLRDFENIEESRRLRKTLLITFTVCIAVIVFVTYIQITGQNKITSGCSYLDPITIDLLAFFAALFLFVEGFFRIVEHPGASLPRQFTRIIRIAFGCAIMTLHIIQFMHK